VQSLIQSTRMGKKFIPIFAGVLAVILLMASAGYFGRPVLITDDGEARQVRVLALTVGQALYAAGISLDPLDQVMPGLENLLPLNREIHIDRAVRAFLWEDGRIRSIAGLGQNPAQLLDNAGVPLEPVDTLWWNGIPLSPDAPLPPDENIVLHIERAQPVTIIANGETNAVTSSSTTVIDALWQAGVQVKPGDWLSVDPASPMEAELVIGYEAAAAVVIQVGEEQVTIHSAADTVGQALAEAGIALQGLDYSQPAEDQPIPPDRTIRVIQVREEIQIEETLIPFESQSAPDPDLDLDLRRVTVPGQYGVQVVRERVRYEDGQEVSRGFDSDWVASEPVAQTVGYGTKVVPKTLDSPDGPIEYYRAVQVYATSYSPCRLGTGKCNYTTASGSQLTKGTIAVTRAWYRQFAGQRIYVPGYGVGVISDVGGGIAGRYWIDLGFDEENYQPMLGWMTIYFLTPAPASVPLVLP
jgi:resuscitation-promoting factor RpfB